MTIHPTLLFN